MVDWGCSSSFVVYFVLEYSRTLVEQQVFLLKVGCFCRFRSICLFFFPFTKQPLGDASPLELLLPLPEAVPACGSPEPPRAACSRLPSSPCSCPRGPRSMLRTPTRDGGFFLGEAFCGPSSPGPDHLPQRKLPQLASFLGTLSTYLEIKVCNIAWSAGYTAGGVVKTLVCYCF